jgi:hypothetical protein
MDWVGALGAAISAGVAFFIAKLLFKAARGPAFYLAFGVLTFVLSLVFRSALRFIGI